MQNKIPIGLLEGLQPEALQFLSSRTAEREVAAGETVFREGDLGDDLYFMTSGSVEIIRESGPTPVQRLAVLQSPNFFGEMSILECRPRAATVRALEPCHFNILISSDLYDMFEEMPGQYALLLHRLARKMARRLRSEGNKTSC